MTRLRQNFAYGTITDNPLLAGATSFNSAELAALVAVTGSDTLAITLDPEEQHGDAEIVIVTAHTALATSATITRGQEGTAAREHPSGTVWTHAPTVADFDYDNLSDLPSLGNLVSVTVIAQGTTTYNLPAGITTILVDCIGAGGGGAGVDTSGSSAALGGGGGGGGFAQKLITSPTSSYTVQVGAGGAGGAAGTNNGSAGTSSDFDGLCTATGGSGGISMTAGTTTLFSDGGGPGAGTVGDFLLVGEIGGNGIRLSGTIGAAGGGGGAARGGGGGRGRTSAGAGGAPGAGWGGGGGGASVLNGSVAAAGATGSNGRIIVYEFGE